MDLKSHLVSRRSVPAVQLKSPAPEGDMLMQLLTMASRAPDHGKLSPWRFIVFEGAARAAAGRLFVKRAEARAAANGETLTPEQLEKEKNLFRRAPLVVGLVFKPIEHPKIPLWEQELAVGAVGMNMLHAATALGFSAQWLTGWPAFDAEMARHFGLDNHERIAGFFHIGTPSEQPSERPRPDIDAMTTYWQPPENEKS